MTNLVEVLKECEQFAKNNLHECCKELIDWKETSILKDGKVRELARMCKTITGDSGSLALAETLITNQALKKCTEDF